MIAGVSPIESVALRPGRGPRAVGCQLPRKRVVVEFAVAPVSPTGVFGAAGRAATGGLAHDRKRSEHGNRTRKR